ncbi:hypothetical protein FF1_017360 [Malus domestica]
MAARGQRRGNGWVVLEANVETIRVCFNKTLTHTTGLWKAENALLSTLPLFFIQQAVIMSLCYLLKLLLTPFHIPRVISHIIGGVILGPSAFGGTAFARNYVFPFKSTLTMETMANLGLIYYMFVLGLQVDFKPIFHARKKVLSIAAAGILLPLPFGYALYRVLTRQEDGLTTVTKLKARTYGPIFWGIILASTNFGELAGVLAHVKLLHSDVGRTALSVSVTSDLICWILLVGTVASTSDGYQVYTVLSTSALIIFLVFVVRPTLSWMFSNTNDASNDNGTSFYDMDPQICFILAGVLFFGYLSDACGAHSILGAFTMGAIVPKGELKNAIIQKVDDFVSNVMMSLFFLVLGMRTHVQAVILDKKDILFVLPVIVLASLAKLVVTFVAAIINKMPMRDSFALGLVMNTKGVVSLIILNSGRDLKVLDHHTFSVMMAAVCVMTAAVGPILNLIYKRNGTSKHYKHRSIRSIQPNSEFRILTCIHSTSNVSGVINLLEASNPTKQSPISVFAVHLVELRSHASAMLIVHDTCNLNRTTSASSTTKNQNHAKHAHFSTSSNNIVAAFEKFESECEEGSVSVEALTTVSSYTTIHEDICNLAEEKQADLIIVPFHKQSTIDGGMDSGNASVRDVNRNLLENVPCSVAVFVDRGLGDLSETKNGNNGQGHRHHRCSMLFIGGPDDREALAYAWRLASNPIPNPNIRLTIVRFIVGKDATVGSDLLLNNDKNNGDHHEEENNKILQDVKGNEKEKQLDDQCIEGFMLNAKNHPYIKLITEVVNNGEETLQLLSDMASDYDLYIVGRGQGVSSPLITFGLSEWGDCPELGPLGDTLVSSRFVANASIIIVHRGASLVDESTDQHLTQQSMHV